METSSYQLDPKRFGGGSNGRMEFAGAEADVREAARRRVRVPQPSRSRWRLEKKWKAASSASTTFS